MRERKVLDSTNEVAINSLALLSLLFESVFYWRLCKKIIEKERRNRNSP